MTTLREIWSRSSAFVFFLPSSMMERSLAFWASQCLQMVDDELNIYRSEGSKSPPSVLWLSPNWICGFIFNTLSLSRLFEDLLFVLRMRYHLRSLLSNKGGTICILAHTEELNIDKCIQRSRSTILRGVYRFRRYVDWALIECPSVKTCAVHVHCFSYCFGKVDEILPKRGEVVVLFPTRYLCQGCLKICFLF